MKPIADIIDLHCDTLTECAGYGLDITDQSLRMSLHRLPQSIRLCQCMAVFIPDSLRGKEAEDYFDRVYGCFVKQMRKYDTEAAWVSNVNKISGALSEKHFAAILTVEGGAVLAGKLENVKRIYDMGVRMMTLTWNAENEICGGSATDAGFTDFGRRVVKEMERLKMAVDVSHLSDKGFYELCDFAEKPFAASHSNSRSVCGHRRNLTDDMFREIMKRGGVVGLNYYKNFIRGDGGNGTINDLLKHVLHFLELGGENTLALGSDFDGADVPDYIDGVDKLPFLIEAFEKSGIPEAVSEKILYKNAAGFFMKIAGGENL